MKDEEKKDYLEKYQRAKEKGYYFFPDILFKDAVVSLLIFLGLIVLAHFVGAPLEARANPADTSYTPRPEWYFLFLFQLLKYFPGKLEVIGVIIIPTIVVLLLISLPFIDHSSWRHFVKRPLITGGTTLVLLAIGILTVQAVQEAPPPTEPTSSGDQTAALYIKNCAPCHGSTISIQPGTNLHTVIAQGKHSGMPAWNGDLTSDQIDALVGFILSPAGDKVFNQECVPCHKVSELVAINPVELKNAIDQGSAYPGHIGVSVPNWSEVISPEENAALLNFLAAPDGQRLFEINCSSCHGSSVAFSGSKAELQSIISKGGLHLEMPPWQGQINDTDLDKLARYVVDPGSVSDGQELFKKYCVKCHGERIPVANNVEEAKNIIASGGAHQTMPIWGKILTSEQLNALVNYTLDAAQGTSVEVGQQLYITNCSPCHGKFGEGGPNPSNPGDLIIPISSAEFLKTRDDNTLRIIIAQGQPSFGMSPFGNMYGGQLDDKAISAIVAFLRTWEKNPPVILPPEIASTKIPLKGPEIYQSLCAQCHGLKGEGAVGPSLSDPNFQAANSNQDIFNIINYGHKTTSMIAWGEILSSDQINQLVEVIRGFKQDASVKPSTIPSFATDVLPIFKQYCSMCHGTVGGWDATNYETVMNSGDHAPVIKVGDANGSLLVQKLLGIQTSGGLMPPTSKLPENLIQIIIDWITSGAPNN